MVFVIDIIGSLILGALFGSSDSSKMTYNKYGQRISKIKNDNINLIKNSNLPEKKKKELTQETLEILDTIESMNTPMSRISLDGIRHWIGNKIPWFKKEVSYKKSQEALEDLISNELILTKYM